MSRDSVTPLVVEVSAPLAPTVTTEVAGLGETCHITPAGAKSSGNHC